jgi:CheY-like chemotaxis protein
MRRSRPVIEVRMRVLVIDDDSNVGAVIKRALKGYDVTYAQSAVGGLGRIAAGAEFAAVVCDYRMPGMDGAQFFDALSRIDAKLSRRIVFITGHPGDPGFLAFVERAACRCIEKPFDGDMLRQAVAAAAAAA